MRIFGLELEGFASKGSAIVLPPKGAPTDGYPGLLEFRSRPSYSLYACYGELEGMLLEFCDEYGLDVSLQSSHTFSREEKNALRKLLRAKNPVDIRNLYGKAPKHLGNRTIASLQINVSERLAEEHRDEAGRLIQARYGIVDVVHVVRSLDAEFADEIKQAKRQPGEYAIKDDVRLEYRSLPNWVFADDSWIQRVLKALK